MKMLVSIVLNLNTIGPLFYDSLIAQDMYLAETILLVISIILVIGNLLADIVLPWRSANKTRINLKIDFQ